MQWDPQLYDRFADLRLRPALDLAAQVRNRSPRHVIDLGCGTGTVTRLLPTLFPGARVIGVDASHEMLAKARELAGEESYLAADLKRFEARPAPDLLYSNAALHWLDDHAELFPRLFASLAEGGTLAVQMPLSWPQPSHALMRAVLERGGRDGTPLGTAALREQLQARPVHDPEFYYDLLVDRARTLELWTTQYTQVLEGEDPVFDWVSGTGLRPVLASLQAAELERFCELYRQELRAAYPRRSNGKTLFPFTRLFLVATRASN